MYNNTRSKTVLKNRLVILFPPTSWIHNVITSVSSLAGSGEMPSFKRRRFEDRNRTETVDLISNDDEDEHAHEALLAPGAVFLGPLHGLRRRATQKVR